MSKSVNRGPWAGGRRYRCVCVLVRVCSFLSILALSGVPAG